ncbi:acetolactate synthase large subunit [Amycolatopsis ultiminotia]
MNGARALLATLLDSGVNVFFANPGTSEMQLVAALDAFEQMHGVLCLFEGVATGAADGYGRMTGRPAATLLHLGPGLGNGMANLHNARRAGTPLVNIVGDHATYHKHLDAPLESDIDSMAGTVSAWLRRSPSVAEIGRDTAAAVQAALSAPDAAGESRDESRTGTSGSVATLIVPADVSWSPGARPSAPAQPDTPAPVGAEVIDAVAAAFRSGEPTVLLLGGAALSEAGLRAASRIEQATGARVFAELWPTRQRQGAGVPAVPPLAYRAEDIRTQLHGTKNLVLAGTREPVSSFAYPGQASELTPPEARVLRFPGRVDADLVAALDRLADVLAPGVEPVLAPRAARNLPSGGLNVANWAQVIGALLPEDAIVCDESITSGLATLPAALVGAAAHDLLGLTGLSVGQGLPLATGAAIACPRRPVVCLEADGSAMYTLSALWTQAREHLDVTTVLLNNRSYAILRAELDRVGATTTGLASARLLDLTGPDLDFVALATGMGVPATRATTAGQLAEQFAAAVAEPGPHLIEAVLGADPGAAA